MPDECICRAEIIEECSCGGFGEKELEVYDNE